MTYWKANEYLAVNAYVNGFLQPHEYMAAWDDSLWSISINEMKWSSSDTNLVYHADFTLTMPSVAAVGPGSETRREGSLELRLGGCRPGSGRAAFVVGLPRRMAAKVEVFDVSGRRVRTVADEVMLGGETRLSWDGCDGRGSRAGSGVYFARLVCADGRRVVRVPLVR